MRVLSRDAILAAALFLAAWPVKSEKPDVVRLSRSGMQDNFFLRLTPPGAANKAIAQYWPRHSMQRCACSFFLSHYEILDGFDD